METALLLYKKFYEKEEALEFARVLNDGGIETEITDDRENLDFLYGDKQFNQSFSVKIKGTDFARADELLLQLSQTDVNKADADHYLYGFSDEELFDVVRKKDEWSEFDFLLAQRILKERGREISSKAIDTLKKERVRELAKPDEDQGFWIIAGYIFAVFGGLIGIFIGWHLNTFKKTLPDGTVTYAYNEDDRKHGLWILILGLFMFVVGVVVVIARME